MNRAGRFAAIGLTLDVMHQAGDWLVQTDRWATRKPAQPDREAAGECSETESWAANQAHVATYHAVQLAGLIAADEVLGLRLHPGRVAAGVALSWASHSIIDRRWPVRCWMDNTGSADFRRRGGAMHVDQAMHHLALWTSALIMSKEGKTRG